MGDISGKIIKIAKEEIAKPITNCINSSILTGTFPDEIKIADVDPVFEKEDQSNKTKLRPISLLPLILKIFGKVLYQQIETFANKILLPKFFGFRKGHSTKHALLNLLKNWQKCLKKAGVVGTALIDLSAYGFDKSAIALIEN